MTIGMLIESLIILLILFIFTCSIHSIAMAGKSGGCHGIYQDGTAFDFNLNKNETEYVYSVKRKKNAFEYFGEQLVKFFFFFFF
jgi:hypothetical protein